MRVACFFLSSFPAIEGELFKALFDAGLTTESTRRPYSWNRCSRTDKGVRTLLSSPYLALPRRFAEIYMCVSCLFALEFLILCHLARPVTPLLPPCVSFSVPSLAPLCRLCVDFPPVNHTPPLPLFFPPLSSRVPPHLFGCVVCRPVSHSPTPLHNVAGARAAQRRVLRDGHCAPHGLRPEPSQPRARARAERSASC